MRAKPERASRKFAPGDVDGYRHMLIHAEAIFQKGFTELVRSPVS